MKRIVHLSDLHFGRDDPPVVKAVIETVRALQPDAIIVSGDLTQRARRAQFVDARAFLDELPFPRLVVPGNHDVPLYNVLARTFSPLGGYRRYVTTDLTPSLVDPPVVIVGMNTTRPSRWKSAQVHRDDVRQICEYVGGFDSDTVKMLVAHHPFDASSETPLEVLTHCGIDVFLTGHVHKSSWGHTASQQRIAGHAAIVVSAGTATSNRLREATNAFNVLDVDENEIDVSRYDWTAGVFTQADLQRFARTDVGWRESA